MKTLQILIVILLISNELYSQNVEPPQRTFNYKGNPNYLIDGRNDDFKQTKFLIGSAWWTPLDTLTALMMKYNIVNTNALSGFFPSPYYIHATHITENCHLMIDMDEFYRITGGSSFQYEPTLKITHSGELETRPNDPTRPIFGFINMPN